MIFARIPKVTIIEEKLLLHQWLTILACCLVLQSGGLQHVSI